MKRERANVPLVSPIFAKYEDVKSFPPTLIITAEFDSLAVEGGILKDKLIEAGADVTYKKFARCLHAFTHQNFSQAKEAWQMMIDYLNKNLKHQNLEVTLQDSKVLYKKHWRYSMANSLARKVSVNALLEVLPFCRRL